jgi:putative DNA primase/helicase
MIARNAEFDRHHTLHAVKNGYVDLKSGELHPPDPTMMFSRSSPHPYIADVDLAEACPHFLEFLGGVIVDEDGNYDRDLARYIHRLLGYSMTGLTVEQIFVSWLGAARNGKSTLANAVRYALGEIDQGGTVATARFDTFQQRRGRQSIPEDEARLSKARIVFASEPDRGAHLNEAMLKNLSGGKSVTARYLYERSFSFVPHFQMILISNHNLRLDVGDLAIAERIVIVPFRRFIEREDRDRTLDDALRAEAPGILTWLVQGAVKYFEEGLGTCDAVTAATDEYLSANNPLAGWLSTGSAIVDPAGEVLPGALHDDYVRFCTNAVGEHERLPEAEWKAAVLALPGVSYKRETRDGTRVRVYKGIRLR